VAFRQVNGKTGNRVFAKMVDEHVEGVIAFTDSVIFRQRDVIVQTALKNGLPGSYPLSRMGHGRESIVVGRISRPHIRPSAPLV